MELHIKEENVFGKYLNRSIEICCLGMQLLVLSSLAQLKFECLDNALDKATYVHNKHFNADKIFFIA
jgi:hypothetical protein